MSKKEINRLQEEREGFSSQALDGSKFGEKGTFDSDLYGELDSSTMLESIPTDMEMEESVHDASKSSRKSINAPEHLLAAPVDSEEVDPMSEYRERFGSGLVNTRISDRESEYQAQRHNIVLSPERGDAFSDQTPSRSYKDIMASHELDRQEEDLRRAIKKRRDEEEEAERNEEDMMGPAKKKKRWDDGGSTPPSSSLPEKQGEDQDNSKSRWDMTPLTTNGLSSQTTTAPRRSSRWDDTPLTSVPEDAPKVKSRWDESTTEQQQQETPSNGDISKTSTTSRWDETPEVSTMSNGSVTATPLAGIMMGLGTPMGGPVTPEIAKKMRYEREIEVRNRPWSDEEIDNMLPPSGYKIMEPPPGYMPVRTPTSKLMSTPTPMDQTPGGFSIQSSTPGIDEYGVPLMNEETDLPFIKPEDYQYFGKLMDDVDEEELDPEEMKERKIMKLLLKIKSGNPPQRKTAFRVITDKARDFGASALFNQILPLLMSPALEDQERHLLVKVIDRVLYKLDDLVRPFVHKILVVIEPLLIDEDYFARVEGREIISNLAKAAGLATMIAAMRPDIDHVDEYVRNTTARAFAVVASALGIPALLPFLKAVCQSRILWQSRHTGIKIVQQVAILMGCGVLPHLKQMVEIIEHGLVDEQQKVRTITGLAIAGLAEGAYPYGIESFDSILPALWSGVKTHRGKGLAAFLKAIGFIIPLMEPDHASRYTKDVMPVIRREFQTPDEEMKKIVLKVVEQCVTTDGVDAEFIRVEVVPEFFRNFWVRRMALDRRNSKLVADATSAIANKIGSNDVLSLIVNDLKDESEPYRRMVMQTAETIIQNLGTASIDQRMEELLIDGVLYAFQEQTTEDTMMILSGFGTVVNALGLRCKPYLHQIAGTIKWRLNNKSSTVRMQAADLIARVAPVMKLCEEEQMMGHLGVVLFEYLGEEYPEVLGSILSGLKAIVNVIGMTKMTPPIKELLPRLTPILKNRHEKVQENVIDLVGRIADRGAEFVSPREWMRICFELLEMLKAHKKSIRRASVNTFGYIAKAIGPQDVLHTLLNNLKVQERQLRVCTTIAIAIVAETCGPFTVLPAVMNEYRLPEMNVQCGVLKTLSFLFEYIGEMGKDYIYAITPLLEHGLMDKDLIHRQTSCAVVKHLSIGVSSLNCEDALEHLLNFVWPNIFETAPHTIFACMEAIEGMMVGLGTPKVLLYTLQGLFHPARRVREVYWKLYNQCYIYGSESMVASLPVLEDDERNSYQTSFLDLHI